MKKLVLIFLLLQSVNLFSQKMMSDIHFVDSIKGYFAQVYFSGIVSEGINFLVDSVYAEKIYNNDTIEIIPQNLINVYPYLLTHSQFRLILVWNRRKDVKYSNYVEEYFPAIRYKWGPKNSNDLSDTNYSEYLLFLIRAKWLNYRSLASNYRYHFPNVDEYILCAVPVLKQN